MRIDARSLLAAWRTARQASVDPFSTSAPDTLPRLPGWSALGLPQKDIAQTRAVTVLDALRALALHERAEAGSGSKVQLVATLPMHMPGVIPTRDAVRDLVVGARNEIIVVGYSITDDGLRDMLVERASGGVAVTVVGDRKNRAARDLKRSWPHGLPLQALEDIEPSVDDRSLHAKVIIADRTTAIVGSANFTVGGLSRNLEFGMRLDGVVARQLAEAVEQLHRAGWLTTIR